MKELFDEFINITLNEKEIMLILIPDNDKSSSEFMKQFIDNKKTKSPIYKKCSNQCHCSEGCQEMIGWTENNS